MAREAPPLASPRLVAQAIRCSAIAGRLELGICQEADSTGSHSPPLLIGPGEVFIMAAGPSFVNLLTWQCVSEL